MPRTFQHSPKWGGARSGAGRPPQKAPSRSISIHLTEELIDCVDRMADRQRISRSAMIAHFLHEAIEKKAENKKTRT